MSGKHKARPKSDWLNQLIEMAKESVRKGGRASPMFFMRHMDHAAAISLDGLNDKDLWSGLMRFLVTGTKPEEYAFIGESWIKMFDPKKEGEKTLGTLVAMGVKQVHEFEDKAECIMILYGSKETGERGAIIRFERKKEGVEFSEIEWLPTGIEGRLSNLWNPFGGESKVN